MRVLLVNTNRFKRPRPVIPIGLCSVASSVEAAGHVVKILDLCFCRTPVGALREWIRSFAPDVVGLGVRNLDTACGFPTLLVDDVRRSVVEPLKGLFEGPIVVGGAAVGINPREILEYFGLAYAISGDGERAFPALLDAFGDEAALRRVPGLTYRKEGHVLIENAPSFDTDVNALGFPRPYRYLDLRWYRRFLSPVQVQTKRGCPLACCYCTYNRIEGRCYRLKEPARIADEIEDTVTHSGVRHFEFADSTFNLPLAHAKRVLRELLARDLDLQLTAMGLHPCGFDEEFVELLRRTGFRDVSVGLESGSATSLAGLGKSYGPGTALAAARLLQRAKIPVQWFLLLGAPGETHQTLAETFAYMRGVITKRDLVVASVGIRLYNGAPLAEAVVPLADDPHLFRPRTYEPAGISLQALRVRSTYEAIRSPQYFLYHRDVELWMILSVIVDLLFRRGCYWEFYVAIRRFLAAVGILEAQAGRYARAHRELLRDDSQSERHSRTPPSEERGAS